MRLALLLVLAGCQSAPVLATLTPRQRVAGCDVRPLTVTSRDLLMDETLADIRRVNRVLRAACATHP